MFEAEKAHSGAFRGQMAGEVFLNIKTENPIPKIFHRHPL